MKITLKQKLKMEWKWMDVLVIKQNRQLEMKACSQHAHCTAWSMQQLPITITALKRKLLQHKRGATIPVFLQEGEREMRSHGNTG